MYDDDDDEDEDDDDEFDPPGVQLNQSATSSARAGSPRPVLKASEIKPILAPIDPDKADPSKDCFTYTTKTGAKIEVPTIITGGYDFENLLCLFCDNQQFKNEDFNQPLAQPLWSCSKDGNLSYLQSLTTEKVFCSPRPVARRCSAGGLSLLQEGVQREALSGQTHKGYPRG
jgi:hypothetical protein